jgi:poly(A) polymerase
MEKSARKVAARLREQGHIAYFAGGCVRDMVRGLTPKDYDIATDARPETVQALFPRTYAVGAHFGVIIVLEDGLQFEVATFRSDEAYIDGRHPSAVHFSSPEEDAKRRDFTINGMFYDPVAGEVIDLVDGQADIAAKLVRAIGSGDRFAEDAAHAAGRSPQSSTTRSTPRNQMRLWPRAFLHQISAERIRDELVRIFVTQSPARVTRSDTSGLMCAILPELSDERRFVARTISPRRRRVRAHPADVAMLLKKFPFRWCSRCYFTTCQPVTATVDKTGRIRSTNMTESVK